MRRVPCGRWPFGGARVLVGLRAAPFLPHTAVSPQHGRSIDNNGEERAQTQAGTSTDEPDAPTSPGTMTRRTQPGGESHG